MTAITKPTKIIRAVIQWTGFFYLTVLIANSSFIGFLVRASASCQYVDPGIVYIDCGDTAFDNLLDLFFFYFSPLIYPVLKIYATGLLTGTLIPEITMRAIAILCFYGFMITSAIVVLRSIIKGFYDVPPYGRQRRKALLAILALFTPFLIILAARLYIMPPSFIHRSITVDVWHGSFSVPRQLLMDWTLADIPRPSKIPNEYAGRMFRKWKNIPYLSFQVPAEILQATTIGKAIEVQVNPHYDRLNDEALAKRRADIFSRKRDLKNELNNKSVYGVKPETEDNWAILKPEQTGGSYYPDLYVSKNGSGAIDHILECTSANYCAHKTYFGWASFPCPAQGPCHSCTKICTDVSQGTGDYNVIYSFERKALGQFEQFEPQIKNFVASYYKPYSAQ